MARTTNVLWLIVLLVNSCGKPTPPAATGGSKPTPDKPATGLPKSSGGESAQPAAASIAPLAFENGLTGKDREAFYHLAEGSEVFPLDWLKVLKNVHTGTFFLDSVDRFGLLPDPENSDGLPVGLTAAPTRDLRFVGNMVGVNCAACHVGQITYNGRAMRIDGATNMFDARAFFTELTDSTIATLADPVQFVAFMSRLHENREKQEGASSSRVKKEVRSLIQHLATEESEVSGPLFVKIKEMMSHDQQKDPLSLEDGIRDSKTTAEEWRNRLLEDLPIKKDESFLEQKAKDLIAKIVKASDAGDSPFDSLSELYINFRLLRAREEFLKRLKKLGDQMIVEGGPGRVDAFGTARYWLFDPDYKPVTPVSYPHIWGFEQVDWLHYDANTTSVIERNVGQALGLGAVYDSKTLSSTILPQNLNDLEHLAAKITPPIWPDELLGKVDREKFARGQKLFDQCCLKCHPRVPSHQQAPDLLFDLTGDDAARAVGTDAWRALSFAENLPESDQPFSGQPYYKALGDALKGITDKAYEDSGISPSDRQKFEGNRVPRFRATKQYAGRPLVAIWASAPFLHNGSVPTIYDLLQPAEKRPKEFPVGQRDYDPVKLGYKTDVSDNSKFTYKTSQDGNRNVGHEGPGYGTGLSESEKWDLIEYLKGPIKD